MELEKGSPRVERLEKAVVPLVPGTSIIMACSYAERVILELKLQVQDSNLSPNNSIPAVGNLRETQRYFDLDVNWQGWEEFGNFFRLRHCFAHELGRVTDKQRTDVTAFLQKLQSGSVVWNGQRVQPYYEITNDEIVMKEGWNDRLRRVLHDFLKLFEQLGLVLEQ
jgi:hypothetical protein